MSKRSTRVALHTDRYSNHDIHFDSEACVPGRQCGPEAALSPIEQGAIRSDLETFTKAAEAVVIAS